MNSFLVYKGLSRNLSQNIPQAVYCILSKHPFVDSGAVPQSIREPEDAYPVAQDDVHLPQPGVWLFLVWRE